MVVTPVVISTINHSEIGVTSQLNAIYSYGHSHELELTGDDLLGFCFCIIHSTNGVFLVHIVV